jgi:hypothetical protein
MEQSSLDVELGFKGAQLGEPVDKRGWKPSDGTLMSGRDRKSGELKVEKTAVMSKSFRPIRLVVSSLALDEW